MNLLLQDIDYDYWVVPASSPYIHPAGWCKEQGIELNPPKGESTNNRQREGRVPTIQHSYIIVLIQNHLLICN